MCKIVCIRYSCGHDGANMKDADDTCPFYSIYCPNPVSSRIKQLDIACSTCQFHAHALNTAVDAATHAVATNLSVSYMGIITRLIDRLAAANVDAADRRRYGANNSPEPMNVNTTINVVVQPNAQSNVAVCRGVRGDSASWGPGGNALMVANADSAQNGTHTVALNETNVEAAFEAAPEDAAEEVIEDVSLAASAQE